MQADLKGCGCPTLPKPIFQSRVVYLLCIFIFALGCTQKSPSNTKPQILVSLPPYKTLVQKIAGEEFDVIAVVPLNADPHSYEPTSKQLSQMAQGKIWFRIGEPFEQKLLPLLQAKSVDMRNSVPMIEGKGCCHAHDIQDRHIWLSPKSMRTQAKAVAVALSEQFPEKKEEFEHNLRIVDQELSQVDEEIGKRIQQAPGRTFLISHPAFAYFCRDYQCRQLSVEHEGKEPRPKEVEDLLQAAIHLQAKIAIALPQHNNKGAQLLANKLNIPVRVIDPYAADYLHTMKKLAALVENPYQTEYD